MRVQDVVKIDQTGLIPVLGHSGSPLGRSCGSAEGIPSNLLFGIGHKDILHLFQCPEDRRFIAGNEPFLQFSNTRTGVFI